jgi:beta-barrel assembly-enhancing protease
MTNSILASLLLFGSLFGSSNCYISDTQATETMRQIARQWPLRPVDDQVSTYVQRTGMRLVSTIDPNHTQQWDFYVLRNSIPSALAVGGRHFVISDGLIALVRNESELAAVLAHEISHQHLEHFCHRPSKSTTRFNQGVVVQHYNLKIEIEADRHATRILAAAGYEPKSLISVLSCLQHLPNRDRSHFSKRINALLQQRLPTKNSAPNYSSSFTNAKAAVLHDLGNSAPHSCR